jgi:magnesium transporter
MLTAYIPHGSSLEAIVVENGNPVPAAAVWLDLVHPTVQEDKQVEQLVGVAVPTQEEMQEIEISSRLYIENGARYMTATLLFQQDTPLPKTTPVTFILSGHRLITVRYDEPKPFSITRYRLGRSCPSDVSGESVLIDLLDAIIDRAADVLERIGAEVDEVSTQIFDPKRSRAAQVYNALLRTIGGKGDHTSKVRESLLSISRLLLFVVNEAEGMRWSKENRAQLKSMHRDVQSLTDHASYLSNKIIFLLDALVGVVSIEQNNIIKIFSVAAVVFLPPTLVASIYGMNFEAMPELKWAFGYPFALGMMIAAAVLPYLYFKWKKWL